eukprot:230585_1
MDPRGELLITGFIRCIQSLIKYQIIPTSIINLCFQFCQKEYFTVHGANISFDKVTNTITRILKPKCRPCTAYGNIQISNNNIGIFSWTFKVLLKSGNKIYIGIDSSNKNNAKRNLSKKHTFYVFNGSTIYDHCGEKKRLGFAQDYWRVNDIIKMEINIKTKRIKYYLNDKKPQTAFYFIDFNNDKIYNLAIHFRETRYTYNGSIQLIHFEFTKLS